MKFNITKEWLQKRATLDEQAEASTGSLKIEDLAKEAHSLRHSPSEQKLLITAFGRLIQFLRTETGLSIHKFAQRADIDEKEVESIENDSAYTPEPRTVYQLSKIFKLPEKRMLELSGNLLVTDTQLTARVERFAASSGHSGQLTKDQLEAIREFIDFLAERK